MNRTRYSQVSLTCRLLFLAKVMAASFTFDSTSIDSSIWAIVTAGYNTPHVDSLFLNFHSMQISNTGNVPFIVTIKQDSIFNNEGKSIATDIVVLKDALNVGSTISFPIRASGAFDPLPYGEYRYESLTLTLDGDNTIADIRRMYQDEFGVAIFILLPITYKRL